MRQRLSLVATLLPDPDVLILDEPTNGIDPSGMVEVRELIGELGRQGKAIFLSSHLLHEVEQVSTRVIILKDGEVLAQTRCPAHPGARLWPAEVPPRPSEVQMAWPPGAFLGGWEYQGISVTKHWKGFYASTEPQSNAVSRRDSHSRVSPGERKWTTLRCAYSGRLKRRG